MGSTLRSARAFSCYHWAGHKKSAFTVERATRAVTHYYFYFRDRDFGAAFIRICPYLPFPIVNIELRSRQIIGIIRSLINGRNVL